MNHVSVSSVRPRDIAIEKLAERCLSWLSPDERRWMLGLNSEALQHKYLVARALCRTTLSACTGVDPSAWRFVQSASGKPSIATPSEFVSLRFNLTHTEDLVACALTRVGEIGIDAELTTRTVEVDAVARHFFSDQEKEMLAGLAEMERRAKFFELWVLKEAYLKACGAGLSQSPESVSLDSVRADGWQLTLHVPTPTHVAATAIHSRSPVPVIWRSTETTL